MKKVYAVLLAILLLLSFSQAALAGGGGPPEGVKVGVFTSVNTDDNTAVFMQNGKSDAAVLKLGEAVKAEAIPVDQKVMISLDKAENGEETVKDVSRMFIGLKLEKILALLLIGLIGGLLSGFIGSGGAFVLTPSMMSLGVPGAVAVASNMCHKFPKAMVGAYKRFKYGQVDLKLGLVMAFSAIVGVQIGIKIQKIILNNWGNAGSNLYVSLVFVAVLVIVGGYVFHDARKLAKGGSEVTTSKLALALQKVQIPPMMNFKTAGVRLSAWVTLPVGLATGMLAATIAVGGFIGVPGMIYVVGASALVASATELVVAFIMGFWGSVQWGISGLIDIRMTLLILAGSLFGVQLGALGTTYVKDYVIKIVMGAVMLIVAVSRGAKVPVYLSDLGLMNVNSGMERVLNSISFWALVAALATAGIIITGAMVKGMMQSRAEERHALQESVAKHG
jgi:uncharacterized membrane protein YfcA